MIVGTTNNDILTGTSGIDEITALSGDDSALGLEGNDEINGNDGNDDLNGNQGNDIVRGGQGNDTVRGGANEDLVTGDVGSDILYGDRGNDVLMGGTSDGGALDVAGNDLIFSGPGNDFAFGNQGDDVISGDEGDDVLFGGQGNDRISGGSGNDRLFGNLGANTLTGGAGTDFFVIGDAPSGTLAVNNIIDFRKGEDFIELGGGLTFANLSLGAGTGENAGGTIVQNAATGEVLAILQSISPNEINQSDFLEAFPTVPTTPLPPGTPPPVIPTPETPTPETPTPDSPFGEPSGNFLSYTDATEGVIVRLDRNLTFESEFGTFPRIMPIGDSITRGNDGITPFEEEGGYRTTLYERLQDFGFIPDFVGSQSSGPSSLPDRDHEAHSGQNIGFFRDNVTSDNGTGFIEVNPADIVLLLAGTNDITRTRDNSDARADNLSRALGRTIERITDSDSFDGTVLVGSIVPFHPDARTTDELELVDRYNSRVPGVVAEQVADGKSVAFVDINRSVSAPADLADLSVDSGIHPNAGGYVKIADAWFDAILDATGTTVPISNVDRIIGSAFNDALVGDSGNNILEGGAGTDRLTGGIGVDSLAAGPGLDGFIYNSPAEGGDLIADFNPAEGDIIMVSASGFGGGLATGTVLTAFVSGPAPIPSATEGTFLYNTNTGNLSFDVDGSGPGAATQIATLQGIPELTADRFALLA